MIVKLYQLFLIYLENANPQHEIDFAFFSLHVPARAKIEFSKKQFS